jgi:hypothetical protein
VSTHHPNQPDDKAAQSIAEAQRVIDDRIFIRNEMKRIKAEGRFFAARHKLSENRDLQAFRRQTEELIDEIVKIAEKL